MKVLRINGSPKEHGNQGKERAFSDVVHEDVYNTISFYMCNHNTAKKNGVL